MLNASNQRRLRPVTMSLLLAVLLSACGSSDNNGHAAAEIKVLGNRADLVSGGDALAEIVLPPDADRDSLAVTVNGEDVTSGFALRDDGRLLGLVTGLEAGANTIEASAAGARAARLEVTNTPRGGPIYSGPQAGPFFCATVTPRPAAATTPATVASGFSTEAVDETCNIAAEYRYYYRSTAASCSLDVPDPGPGAAPDPNLCFQPYDPAAPAPADLAMTTTDTDLTVPYVVRVERGTMNRGIYDIAVLVDPTQPWTSGVEPQPSWNGKVHFHFGGSGGQPRRQLLPASGWTDDMSLSRGWLVAVNTMTDASRNNNRVVTAETVMMMKEHIVDRYGEIRYTIASGGSAGSINTYSVASQHPGLIDGALMSASLLDYDTSHIINYECGLLTEAYNSPAWKAAMTSAGYTQQEINLKRASIERHKDHTVCQGWYNSFGQQRWNGNNTEASRIPPANADTGEIAVAPIDPPTNNCDLPPALVWDPVSNPNGVRCGPWDWAASVYGKSADGVGNSTRDTVGIQYGLLALREGTVTPEEFVVLNESVGGLSPVGELTADRTVASLDALETVYRSGLIIGPGLDSLAIINMQGDDNLHPYWRAWGVRERLEKENGHHDNQVIWQFPGSSSVSDVMRLEAMQEMDKWLTAVKADTSDLPVARKVAAARPGSTVDYCLLTSKDPTVEPRITDPAVCRAESGLEILGSPRQGAGGPLAEDIMKCQLKPIDVADYAPAVLSAGQLARLQAVFPDGVCDWSEPGVGKQPKGAVPFTYVNGPGGEPLPAAPASQVE